MQQSTTILAGLLICTIGIISACSDRLITEGSRNGIQVISPIGASIPILENGQSWQLEGVYGTVKLSFPSEQFFTGLGIRITTNGTAPCTFIESGIDLRDYELILDGRHVEIPIRSIDSQFNQTFLRVAYTPTSATSVEIRKLQPVENLPRYCIQYQLYGCNTVPASCGPLLAYDITQPIWMDATYNGTCLYQRCTGGLGILTDGQYELSLSWSRMANFRLTFYQSVGVQDITIYLGQSSNAIRSTPMFAMLTADQMVLRINQIINHFAFNLNSNGNFSVLEIRVRYWVSNQKNDVSIPCPMNSGSAIQSQTVQVIVPITTSILAFILGVAITLFMLWFSKKKLNLSHLITRSRPCEDGVRTKKIEKSEHYYSDPHTSDSTTRINTVRNVDLHEIGVSKLEAAASFQKSVSIGDRDNTIDRYSVGDSMRSEEIDNPLYGGSDKPAAPRGNGKKLVKFESDMEIKSNPQYDSYDKAATTLKEDVFAAPTADEFDTYNKLQH